MGRPEILFNKARHKKSLVAGMPQLLLRPIGNFLLSLPTGLWRLAMKGRLYSFLQPPVFQKNPSQRMWQLALTAQIFLRQVKLLLVIPRITKCYGMRRRGRWDLLEFYHD